MARAPIIAAEVKPMLPSAVLPRIVIPIAVALLFCCFGSAEPRSEQISFDDGLPKDCAVREGYVTVPGGKVWYQVVGTSDATPLLVLHGGPGFPHDYLEPIGRLCKERPVIFYDQLGCGKSDRPTDKSLWKIDRFVQELARVREELKLKRVHILGQSWGTMLLTDYMLTRPAGVESVIFSNPAISMPQFEKDSSRYRKELPRDVQATLERHEKMGSLGCPEYQSAVLTYYKRHLCRLNPWPDALERTFAGSGEDVYQTMNGPTEFMVTGNIKDYDRTARLREIKQPSLFICGRYDETTPEATSIYHRNLPGSEMVVFEKSAHLPMLEETDRYLKVVSDFLRRSEHR